MKKILTALLVSSMLLTLTACGTDRGGSPNDGAPNDNGSAGSGESPDDNEKPQRDAATQKLIDEFPLDEITLPDGSTISKNEAVGAGESSLTFDFAYIRYAEPYFESTRSSADLFDRDTYEFNVNFPLEVNDPEWIRIKTGDVLENGAAVSDAVTEFYYYGGFGDASGSLRCTAELDGSVEVEGILMEMGPDPFYDAPTEGCLQFYPDGSKSKIPLLYNESTALSTIMDGDFALIFDGFAFDLGNIADAAVDLSGEFSDDNYIGMKLTLTNVKLNVEMSLTSSTYGGTAEITAFEPL